MFVVISVKIPTHIINVLISTTDNMGLKRNDSQQEPIHTKFFLSILISLENLYTLCLVVVEVNSVVVVNRWRIKMTSWSRVHLMSNIALISNKTHLVGHSHQIK